MPSFTVTADKVNIVEGESITFTIVAVGGAVPASYRVITSINSDFITSTQLTMTAAGNYTCQVTVRAGGLTGDYDSLYITVRDASVDEHAEATLNITTGISTFCFVQSFFSSKNVGLSQSKTGAPFAGPFCFPAEATVLRKDKKTVAMKDLQLNDEVQVADGVYSPVYLFTHQRSDVQSPFVQLTTATGFTLCLSPCHYVYVNGQAEPVLAKNVNLQDTLTTAQGVDKVIAIDTRVLPGLYNPHTLHGDIMVNGILTSTYTAALTPTLAHAVLAPVRFMYSMGLAY